MHVTTGDGEGEREREGGREGGRKRSHASERERKTEGGKKQACFLQCTKEDCGKQCTKEGCGFLLYVLLGMCPHTSYTDICLAYKAYSDFRVYKLSTPGAEPTASTFASDSGFKIVVVASAMDSFFLILFFHPVRHELKNV